MSNLMFDKYTKTAATKTKEEKYTLCSTMKLQLVGNVYALNYFYYIKSGKCSFNYILQSICLIWISFLPLSILYE
jgi:hypothetical protein